MTRPNNNPNNKPNDKPNKPGARPPGAGFDWDETHLANLKLDELRQVKAKWVKPHGSDEHALPECIEKDDAIAALDKIIALRIGDPRKLNPVTLSHFVNIANKNSRKARRGEGTPRPPKPPKDPPPDPPTDPPVDPPKDPPDPQNRP